MNRLQSQTKSGAAVVDVLSVDAGKRRIELAFMGRLNALLLKATRTGLERAYKARGFVATAAQSAQRMQSPAYVRLARALEKSVPETTGFGRFRE